MNNSNAAIGAIVEAIHIKKKEGFLLANMTKRGNSPAVIKSRNCSQICIQVPTKKLGAILRAVASIVDGRPQNTSLANKHKAKSRGRRGSRRNREVKLKEKVHSPSEGNGILLSTDATNQVPVLGNAVVCPKFSRSKGKVKPNILPRVENKVSCTKKPVEHERKRVPVTLEMDTTQQTKVEPPVKQLIKIKEQIVSEIEVVPVPPAAASADSGVEKTPSSSTDYGVTLRDNVEKARIKILKYKPIDIKPYAIALADAQAKNNFDDKRKSRSKAFNELSQGDFHRWTIQADLLNKEKQSAVVQAETYYRFVRNKNEQTSVSLTNQLKQAKQLVIDYENNAIRPRIRQARRKPEFVKKKIVKAVEKTKRYDSDDDGPLCGKIERVGDRCTRGDGAAEARYNGMPMAGDNDLHCVLGW
jgi:hypothetical protein